MPIIRIRDQGPQHLTELAHDIFLLLDQGPQPTDLKTIFTVARQARERRAEEQAGVPLPALTCLELDQAVAELERTGYVEKISRPAGELFRLTPWAKKAAADGNMIHHWELLEWHSKRRRGRASEDSRPRRSEVKVWASRWWAGPSFADLIIDQFGLPMRTANTLVGRGIETVGELTELTVEELRGLENIGPKSIAQIESALETVGLELGSGIPAAETAERLQPEGTVLSRKLFPSVYEVYDRAYYTLFRDSPEHKRQRVLWAGPVLELAMAHDTLCPGPVPRAFWPLREAFQALVVLVEPTWWREHSPPASSAEEDLRWLRTLGRRDPIESLGAAWLQVLEAGRDATWRALEGLVSAAAETFVRGRDPKGLRRCAQVLEEARARPRVDLTTAAGW